jgi:hypothetical protein
MHIQDDSRVVDITVENDLPVFVTKIFPINKGLALRGYSVTGMLPWKKKNFASATERSIT